MKLSLKSLKNLTDSYHKADYKSGGNYQTSYYRFLEEGGTIPPEVRIAHLPLTCDYILSTTSIPFTIDVRTHNKIVGDVEVVTTLGESSHTSYQLSNESYTFTFNANSIDVADRRGIEVTFTGLNKFEEIVTYSVNVSYEREADCYSLACESNSDRVSFEVDSRSIYAFSVNGRTYQVNSLIEFQRIAKDNDLKVSFYRKPLEWSSWNVNSEVTINELGVAKYTGYKTNTEAYYDSFADFDLTDAITNSFQDPDMQQWQGFKDAVNELTGVANWVLDPANNRIKYYEVNDPDAPDPDFIYQTFDGNIFQTKEAMGRYMFPLLFPTASQYSLVYKSTQCDSRGVCTTSALQTTTGKTDTYNSGNRIVRPITEPIPEPEEKSLPLPVVAQKVISNVSSSNQAISLFAEAYLEAVASSIFSIDEPKQFVKLSNILEQFEQNKVLRG